MLLETCLHCVRLIGTWNGSRRESEDSLCNVVGGGAVNIGLCLVRNASFNHGKLNCF